MKKVLAILTVLVALAVAGTTLTTFANQSDPVQTIKLADVKANMSSPRLNRVWITCTSCNGSGRCATCGGLARCYACGGNGGRYYP